MFKKKSCLHLMHLLSVLRIRVERQFPRIFMGWEFLGYLSVHFICEFNLLALLNKE